MSDYWTQFEGRSVPLKGLLQWLSDEHDHVTDDEGELLEGWDFPVVNSMALHRWAIVEAVEDEFEYALSMKDQATGEWNPCGDILDQYNRTPIWGEVQPRERLLEWYGREFPNSEFKLVKRRKAGGTEDV
jgi:hypothetical protein